MKRIFIAAGPNGAGKTSFARQYLDKLRPGLVDLNADELARDPAFKALQASKRGIRVGRKMPRRMDELTACVPFMFESAWRR